MHVTKPSTCPLLDEAIRSGQLADDPYSVYRRLREDHPVVWSDAWQCWVFSRYDDVSPLLRDHERFSNVGRVTNGFRGRLSEDERHRITPLIDHYSRGLINSDPPDHTRLRRLVQAVFVPRMLERLRPRVQQIVDDLIDRVVRKGEMEIIGDLSYPLPVTVIAELLGIPAGDHERFKAWSSQIVAFMATPAPSIEVVTGSQKALLELREFFRELFAARRRTPTDDLLGNLVNTHLDGDHLSEEELLSTCVTILIGGHETTTSLLASAVWLLLRHPEQWQRLRDDPSRTPGAIEECLRYEPPFQRVLRVARQALEWNGAVLQPGSTVMLLLGSANRDETAFAEPDRFDIDRHPNRHVSFGYGIHFCLGASLARIEAPIAIETLARRTRGLGLCRELPQWDDGMVRSLRELRVRFHPQQASHSHEH